MVKLRRARCPHCGFLESVKCGKQGGKQRYKCKNCSSVFSLKKSGVSASNKFVWFREWVIGKQTLTAISRRSSYSVRTLQRLFDSYLENYPEWEFSREQVVNLLLDGTYFPNKICLVVYRNQSIKKTLFYRQSDGEYYDEILEDLRAILSLGIWIESVTCDGKQAILKAVHKADKNIVIQRCTVHIQLVSKIWLTQNPQSQAGRELLQISQKINSIIDIESWGYWIVSLVRWEQKHRDYLNQKTHKEDNGRSWFTHKMVRRSFVTIRRALPNMFHYLNNPNIPKSTNSLESFFGHLKQKISIHRGLSKPHFAKFLVWYLYFNNNVKK